MADALAHRQLHGRCLAASAASKSAPRTQRKQELSRNVTRRAARRCGSGERLFFVDRGQWACPQRGALTDRIRVCCSAFPAAHDQPANRLQTAPRGPTRNLPPQANAAAWTTTSQPDFHNSAGSRRWNVRHRASFSATRPFPHRQGLTAALVPAQLQRCRYALVRWTW